MISNSNSSQNTYYNLYTSIVNALAHLPEGYDSVEIAGLGYLQGEGNGNSSSTPQAGALTTERLNQLVTDLKSDIGKLNANGIDVKVDGMKLVIGQINGDQTLNKREETDAQQQQMANNNPANIAYVPARGLPNNSDNIHYASASQIVIGERFAEAFVSLGTSSPTDTSLLTWNGGIQGNWNSASWNTDGKTWDGTRNIAVFNTENANISITELTTAAGLNFQKNATIAGTGKLLTLTSDAVVDVSAGTVAIFDTAVNITNGFAKSGQGSLIINNADTNLLGAYLDIREGTLEIRNAAGLTSRAPLPDMDGLGYFKLHEGTTLKMGMQTTQASGVVAAIDVAGNATLALNNSVNTFRNVTNTSDKTSILNILSGGNATQLYLSSVAGNVVVQLSPAASGESMSGGASYITGEFGGLSGGWNSSTNGNFRIDGDASSSSGNGLTINTAKGETYTFSNMLANHTANNTLRKKEKEPKF